MFYINSHVSLYCTVSIVGPTVIYGAAEGGSVDMNGQAGPLPPKDSPGLLPPPYTGPGEGMVGANNPAYMPAGLVAPGAGAPSDMESEGAFSPPTGMQRANVYDNAFTVDEK